MLVLSKRLMGLGGMILVELIMASFCLLAYTGKMYVTWDETKALGYGFIFIGVAILTSILFYFARKRLNTSIIAGSMTTAMLITRQQLGMLHRKLIIWTYKYTVDNQTYTKKYWHISNVRELTEGQKFLLLTNPEDPKRTYFFYERRKVTPIDSA